VAVQAKRVRYWQVDKEPFNCFPAVDTHA